MSAETTYDGSEDGEPSTTNRAQNVLVRAGLWFTSSAMAMPALTTQMGSAPKSSHICTATGPAMKTHGQCSAVEGHCRGNSDD